jgi:anaerobic nitric oxide reductase transcription regulator
MTIEKKESPVEQALMQIALDLCTAMPSKKINERLIVAIDQVMPCDACALLVLEQGELRPIAIKGLYPRVMEMRFNPEEQPRLKAILESKTPVRFPAFSALRDPFDGHVVAEGHVNLEVHACMGCSLYVEDHLVGLLTLDSLDAHAFDSISNTTIATFAALAAAALRNAKIFNSLEKKSNKNQLIANELMFDAVSKSEPIIGDSFMMQQLKADIEIVAQAELSVLIQGETGTGKELVIRSIYQQSKRNTKPLVMLNCAALPESVAESELFGHAKGAFTGAVEHRVGKFELAHKGTLVLDEVGELPLTIQAKLLRALQLGEIQRVGSDKQVKVDVRVIAATNRNLQQEIEKGTFRADLYHRLCVFPLVVPALRARKGDIAALANHFVKDARSKAGIPNLDISKDALAQLQLYDWPGNVRELEHLILRASLLASKRNSEQPQISTQDLSLCIPASGQPVQNSGDQSLNSQLDPLALHLSFNAATAQFQKQIIQQALSQNDGIWARAAKQLEINRSNLHRVAKRLELL